ncbi:serine/threonine-protein kinase BSK1-2-like [Dioscorea cayenensis subsp. rotundata]|uniref:Serine/threonine-protein kinase BSK1-2-like n=1 Tax=Dioscorea cayennensis subsp. rotundata TaxID=55577 RepID=A0AB40C3F6_DIOCR|nr:serine/threonine-protein kinase BSK1-2-like [Dioscorea cayenensis subsp. rotundata]
MDCCLSAPKQQENSNSGDDSYHDGPGTNVNPPHHQPSQPPDGETVPFRQYTLEELSAATHEFARAPVHYLSRRRRTPEHHLQGHLDGGQQIAVKRFSKYAWPDEEQFREQAIKAGRLRHRRLARLIGYCFQEDMRLLVAEFMPNDSLTRRLLYSTTDKTMEWSMRLRVTFYIAEALEYCINEGQALYFDLNSNKVRFDKAIFVTLKPNKLCWFHST